MISGNKNQAPLRFVVLSDSKNLEQWQVDCILEAVNSGVASLVGFVIKAPSPQYSFIKRWKQRWESRNVLAWRIYDRFFVRPFSKSTKGTAIDAVFSDAPQCSSAPNRVTKYAQKLDDNGMAFIRELAPDFLLRFGFGILTGEVLKVAELGLWSYHHGDPAKFRGQPPGFWEIYNNCDSAGAILQVLNEKLDGGRVLHSGEFALTKQSYAKTRDTLYYGSTSFVRRACYNIIANGPPLNHIDEKKEMGPVYRQPTFAQVIRFALINIRARITAIYVYKALKQNWNCAVIREPIHAVAGLNGYDSQQIALRKAVWMAPSEHEFYADPFGVSIGPSKFRIFVERFDWKKRKGDIATTVFDGETFGPFQTALEAKTHLSYPYTARIKGEQVFIPEHSEGRDVSSFDYDSNGVAYKKKTIFAKSDLIDTTFFELEGQVWAFALIDGHASNTHLHLFFADAFDGPWYAHPLNPIKSSIRSARPAGTPFIYEGRLYRPSQDCSKVYGGSITINEVLVLSQTDYKEIEVNSVRPSSDSQYKDGLHTISSFGSYTLIDGARRIRK